MIRLLVPRLALLGLVLLGFQLAACAPDRSNLEPIPHPESVSPEAPVEAQIDAARDRVERALVRRDDAELAASLGALGDLYQAYGLAEPAGVAYRNAAALEPESFAWPYALGLLAETEGDFAAARDHFERAIELRPSSAAARIHLGEAFLALGDAEAAEAAFRRVAEESSADAGNDDFAAISAHGLGRAALARGDAEAAVEHFRRVLEIQPEAGSVRSALGNALRQAGDAEAAEAELEAKGSGAVTWPDPLAERLERLPRSSGAFLDRGNGALLAGRLDEAIEELSRGVETHPENVELRRDLGLAQVRAGRLDDALRTLEAAVEIAPENARAWHDLGTTRQARGELDAAVTALRRAVEIEDDFEQAHFNLANALGASGDWAGVAEHAARVLELEGDRPRARYLLAMSRVRGGETEAGLETLRELVAAEPDEPVYRQGLVTALVEAGRVGDAVAAANVAAEALPANDAVPILRAAAQATWRRGNKPAAIQLWRRVTEIVPESSQAWSELANGLQLAGRRAEARAYFRKSVEADPKNATSWLSEASLAILAGDFADAAERLRLAVAEHPEHPGLANVYARILATAPDASLRDGERAIQLARFAYGAEGSLDHAETLAMALAEAGHFEEAISLQQNLAQRVQAAGDRNALARLVTNLRRYQNRQPVRVAAN